MCVGANGAEAGGLRVNKLVAWAISANRGVGLEGVGDADGGQKGKYPDDVNRKKQRSEHCDATSTSGTPGVQNLGTEVGKEDQ